MSVYMIIDIQVKDNEMYSKYIEKVPEIISKYGGRYLTRGGKIIPLTGNWNPERIVLIQVDSIEQLQRCFQSPEYLEIAPLREQATVSRAIIVEGCTAPQKDTCESNKKKDI